MSRKASTGKASTPTLPTPPKTVSPIRNRFKEEVKAIDCLISNDILTLTGICAPPSIPLDSTSYLPIGSDLDVRRGTDINGEGQYQIIRFPQYGEDWEEVIIATLPPTPEGKENADKFLSLYAKATYSDRAYMVGAKDWVERQQIIIAESIKRIGTNGGGSTYSPKVELKPTSIPDVKTGVSDCGKKRLTWRGYSGFGLARYLGSKGWSGKEAKETFKRIGLPMGETAIIGGVYAGKKGTRGTPAPVTETDHAALQSILDDIRSREATSTEETPKAKAKTTPTHTPTPPPTKTVTPTLSKKEEEARKLDKAMKDRKESKAKEKASKGVKRK